MIRFFAGDTRVVSGRLWVWAGLIGSAFAVGGLLRAAGALPVDALPPLHAHARLLLVPLLPAVALAAGGVFVLPVAARRLGWRSLLGVAWVSSAAWAVALQAPDGLSRPLTNRADYLAGLPAMGNDPLGWLRGFTRHLGSYPIHVKGHPPLPMLILWILRWTGLGGANWAAALLITAGTSATVAIAMTVQGLASEDLARRAVPFLVLSPAVICLATSMDALFLGATAWTTALLTTATDNHRVRGPGGDTPRPPRGTVPYPSSRVVDSRDKRFHRLWITRWYSLRRGGADVGGAQGGSGTGPVGYAAQATAGSWPDGCTAGSKGDAAARSPSTVDACSETVSEDHAVCPVRIDVRSEADRAAAAPACVDAGYETRFAVGRPVDVEAGATAGSAVGSSAGGGSRSRLRAGVGRISGSRADVWSAAGRLGAAGVAGLLAGSIPYLSYGLVTALAMPLLVLLLTRPSRTVVVAFGLGVLVVPLAFTASGFDWWDGVVATHGAWAAGAGAHRPYAYFIVGDLAVLALIIGPMAAQALPYLLRHAARPVTSQARLGALLAAALIGVLALDLSGVTRGEVERIWLPYAAWMTAGAAVYRPPARRVLVAQAVTALLIQALVRSPW